MITKTNIVDFVKSHKVLVGSILGIFVFCLVSLGVFLSWDKKGNNNFNIGNILSFAKVFEVSGGNFDLNIQKIPYNVKSIDITLTQDIDEKSIKKDIFKISPEIPGVIKVKNKNTLSYELSETLKIGSDYSVTLSKDLQSIDGKKLEHDTVYILKTTDSASVVKIFPEGELTNLSQNIGVFFSIPMMPLTNLDEKDKLPCPLEITPKVEGKCIWITTSVLEFIPKKAFHGATKYTLKVKNMPGMNYVLDKEVESTFSTPRLTVQVEKKFKPKDSIQVNFNYPVDIEQIKKQFTLNYSGSMLSGSIESVKNSEMSFIIKPVGQEYFYDASYSVVFTGGIMPKYGNIPTEKSNTFLLKSDSFVGSVTTYQNIFSSTGSLIDTVNFTNYSIPNKNMFFKIKFLEEINLDKNLFIFQEKNGKKIDFELSYAKKELRDEKNSENITLVDDKNVIHLTVKGNLENSKNYELIVNKTANKNILSDIVHEYKTSSKLEILGFTFIDYSRSCLYTNNELMLEDGYEVIKKDQQKNITFSNSGIIKSVSENQEIDWGKVLKKYKKSDYVYNYGGKDYNGYYYLLDDVSFEEKNKLLSEAGYCKLAGTGQVLYAIDTRLFPNKIYTFGVKNLSDKYGNTLETPFSKEVKTGKLRETDQYAYISYTNDTNVYPKHLPIVINFQTVNTEKINVEVCEMDEMGYIDYIRNRNQNCKKSTTKELATKNVYWNVINNTFDVEKDILGANLEYDYVLLQVYPQGNTINGEEKMIVRTNMSLFLEKASNKSVLYATDIETHSEIEGLDLKFYVYQYDEKTKKDILKETTIKYTYDKAKKVYIIENDLGSIAFITVKNKTYAGIITENDVFSNYDFKYISGMDSTTKNYAYVYTDRPIYRPGDEVFIKGILREFHFDGYKKSTLKKGILKIKDQNYVDYRTIEVNIDKNSNFSGSFVIPKESPLGTFTFEFEGEKTDYYVYTNGYFDIEEYKKPTFKIDISEEKNDYLEGEKLSLKVEPKYYFGGKMINTKGTWSVLGQQYYFDAKEYNDYQFGEGQNYFDCVYWGYCSFDDKLSEVKDFKVNENGVFDFEYTFGEKSGEKIYTVSFDVVDPDTQKTVSNSVSKVVHNTDGYVGIKNNYYNTKKDGISFDLAFLSHEATPLANKKAQVEIIKREWKEVKTLGVDGVYYNEYTLDEKLEKTIVISGDNTGIASYNYKPLSSGEYEIKASYTGTNNKSFVSSSIVYVSGDEYISWRNNNNTVTELTAEKITYKLGETAVFTLKSPVKNGKALLVIEKDDGIIDYFVHPIKSYGDKIEIKLTEQHYPNIYIKAYLIGNQDKNHLPVYKRALGLVKVLTDYKNLNVTIQTDKKHYKPAEALTVNIEVVDKNGKKVANANGSLSVVDESVLALKGNPRKNPYSFFYDMKRYLGVVSYINLKYLVEKLEVKDVTGGEKGGAGDEVKGGDTKKLRGNFKDTAFWQSDFTTDASGKAKIVIPKLPDNLTTWVIEALVNTPEDNKIGVNYETIQTNLEVMINENMPRFFGAGDKITLSPVVFNKTTFDDTFTVTLKASSGTVLKGEQKIFIKSGEQITVPFEIEMIGNAELKGNDVSKIEISAVSQKDPTKSDGVVVFIPIHNSSTLEQVSTIGKTSDFSYQEAIKLGNVLKQDSTLTLNYGGTLFSYLLDGLDYLANYPYGCAEQRTSAIMPNIYMKNLYTTAGKEFDLKKKMIKKYIDSTTGYKEISVDESIKDYLTEIKKFQNIDGGFMYWYDMDYKQSDLHLTNYILSSHAQIKALGYEVDASMMANSEKYLKNQFYKLPLCNNKIFKNCLYIEQKGEILSALLDYNPNDYEVYKMYKVLDGNNIKSNLGKALLLGKLLNISSIIENDKKVLKKEAIDIIQTTLNNELVFNPRGAFLMGYKYNRSLSNAKLLEIIAIIGKENFKNIDTITDSLIRFIASSKMNGSFGSTYDDSNIFRSLTTYLATTKELTTTDYFAKFFVNTTQVENKKISKDNIFDINQKVVSLSDIKDTNTFHIEKTGTGTVYYDLSLKYFLPSKDIASRDEGFFVEKMYYDYGEYKKIDSLKSEEYQKYLDGEIEFKDLKYDKEVVEYLKPIISGKVGDLVLVYHKIITNEDRDQVALESFIPAGSEIVNTKLATETKLANVGSNLYLDREEMRDDRYFAWQSSISPGFYNVSYVIRLTHAGKFQVKPTRVSEFYNQEVFGRSNGVEFEVK